MPAAVTVTPAQVGLAMREDWIRPTVRAKLASRSHVHKSYVLIVTVDAGQGTADVTHINGTGGTYSYGSVEPQPGEVWRLLTHNGASRLQDYAHWATVDRIV